MPKVVRDRRTTRPCEALGPGRRHDGEGLVLNVMPGGVGRARVFPVPVG